MAAVLFCDLQGRTPSDLDHVVIHEDHVAVSIVGDKLREKIRQEGGTLVRSGTGGPVDNREMAAQWIEKQKAKDAQ